MNIRQMFATLLETNEKKENVLSLLHEMEETVSSSFKYLLRLSSAGGLGETICTEQANVDWHSLLQLAFEQSVFPVTAYAILQDPEIMPDTEVQQDLLEQIRYSSYRNILRRQRIMGLLREMEEHGIQAVLLKGYEVAQCYQMPECRESADTDVLVPKECERAAHDFLKEKGFTLEPRGKAGHHSVGQHKKYGMVELHVNLYDEIIQEVWFQGMRDEDFILESLRREKTKEESYLTLGCTDHLLFLMLHMVKHFIISGTSLGMMLDTALFFRKHRAKIDTDRIWKILDTLNYRIFVSAVLQAFVQYGLFSQSGFPGMEKIPTDLVDRILWDVEQGGRMGVREKAERIDCSFEYNRRVMRKEMGFLQYICYMLVWRTKKGIKYMFPSKEMLEILHPVIKGKPELTLWFRLYQLFVFPFVQITTGFLKKEIRTNHTSISEISRKRIELFSDVRMI